MPVAVQGQRCCLMPEQLLQHLYMGATRDPDEAAGAAAGPFLRGRAHQRSRRGAIPVAAVPIHVPRGIVRVWIPARWKWCSYLAPSALGRRLAGDPVAVLVAVRPVRRIAFRYVIDAGIVRVPAGPIDRAVLVRRGDRGDR